MTSSQHFYLNTWYFQRFPAEIHLVHVKEDYVDDISGALAAGDGLSVLGIFIEANATFNTKETSWFNVITMKMIKTHICNAL